MHKKISKKMIIVGLGLSLLILAYFGISFYVAKQFVAAHPSRMDIPPTFIAPDYEDVTIQGADQINLKGWLFRAKSDKLVILVHGFTENRINTGYYSVFIAKELLAQNYNVLMYDSRAHGESDGDQITYGIKESQDIVNVVDFAKTKNFAPNHVAIIADSLGAISLLVAADDLQNVGALIVDSPAAHVKPVMEGVMQREHHIPALFNPGVFFLLKVIYNVDVDAIQPLKSVAAAPDRRFLLFHGALDQTTPLTDSQELLKTANPSSKLIVFPNGSHIETYKNDPQKYREALFPFLEEELNK